MAPMMIENENDVEVGESLPPMTEHVSQICELHTDWTLAEYARLSVSHYRLGKPMLATKRAKTGLSVR